MTTSPDLAHTPAELLCVDTLRANASRGLHTIRKLGFLIVALLLAGCLRVEAQTAHYLLAPSVVDMGSTTVQGIPTTALVTFVFNTSGTLGSVVATTQGAQGASHLDFQAQLSLPCASGQFFIAGGACVVLVTFTPYAPGVRTGAVELLNNSGTVFATAYLTGVGVAGQASFPPGTKSILGTGLNQPQHVAVDAIGNVLVADSQNHRVVKIPWTGSSYGAQTTVGTGWQTPWGVAVDGGGNVFVSDSSANNVVKVPWTGSSYGTQTTLAFSGLSTPQGLGLDTAGNIFVADKLNNRILELPWNGIGYGTQVSIGTVNQPYGIALDPLGDVYVADPLDFVLKVIPRSGLTYGSVSTFPGYSGGALDLTVDGNGNLYIADPSSLNIQRFPWTGLSFGSLTTLGSALAGPEGIAVDAQGNLYVGETDNSDIIKLDVVTPPSLNFLSTPAGTTSSDSPLTINLFNMGNAALIFPIPVSGSIPFVSANFTLNNAGTCPSVPSTSLVTGILGIGAGCTVAVSFTPSASATGSLTGNLTIVDNTLQFLGVSQTISLSGTVQSAQTINFTAPTTPVTYGVSPVTLTATASSGLPVTFSVVSGPATVAGATLSITGAGTVVAAANQAGNSTYAPAPQVTRSIVVNQAAQTISFTAPATPVSYGVAPVSLSATASSGLAVSFSVLSGPATVSGSTLTISGTGTVVVAANQAGDTNYSAATQVTESIVVNKASQTITFTPPTTPVTYGVSPITLTATASSGDAVTFSVVSGPATVSGSTLTIIGAGTVVVAANQAGDSNYSPATQVSQSIVVNKAGQTITFTPPTTPVTYGVSPISLSATTSSGNAVIFSVVSGPGTISGSTLTITGGGTVVVAANQAGDANYSTAAQVTQSILVNKAAQTITFTPPTTPVTYGVSPITLSATATSGDAVIFSVVSGPATVSGSALTITGAGTVVVAANQAGDANYSAAAQVTQTIVVNKAAQTITFTPPISPVAFGISPISLSATASSGQAVTFSVVSGPATVNGSTLTLTGAGTVVVAADQPGNANYSAAAQVTQTIVVSKGSQTITFTPPASPVAFGVSPFTLTAVASSGDAVTYSLISGPATLSGATVTITGAGTVVVAANQAGDANYSAAAQITRSIVVNKAAQTIAFTPPTTPVIYGVSPISLFAKATSGDAVTFSLISGPATVSGSTLTIIGAGTVIVAANQTGNSNYAAAALVKRTIVVNKAAQTISFTAPATPVTLGLSPITLSATASSGLAVAFSVVSGPATVSGSTLTITGAGSVVVAANQSGNTNYAAATRVTHTIVVNRKTQQIAFTQPSTPLTFGVTPITLSASSSSGLTVAFSVASGPAAVSGSTLTVTGAGIVVISAHQAGNANYTAATPVNRSIVVNKRSQTITFTPPASPVLYGTKPIVLIAVSSSKLPVAFTVLSGPARISGTALSLTGIGTVVVAANQTGNANYIAAVTSKREIIVRKATQSISFPAFTRPLTYGAPNVSLQATSSSKLPVAFHIVSGPARVNGTALTIIGAGTIVIAANQAGDTLYSAAAQVTRSIPINKAALVVSATNKAKFYGAAMPPLTFIVTGFVRGDLQVHAVQGLPLLSTTATASSPVGSYPISIAAGTLTSANYTFTFRNATLVVAKANLAVVAANRLKVYGTANPAFSYTLKGFANGDTATKAVAGSPVLSSPATAKSAVGTYSIAIAPGTLTSANYRLVFVPGKLAITKALLKITANNLTMKQGAAVPTLTFTTTGFVNDDTFATAVTGSPSLTTNATSKSATGQYPIVISVGTLHAANYSLTMANGKLTITP